MEIKTRLDKVRDKEIKELQAKVEKLERRIEEIYTYYDNHLTREHNKFALSQEKAP